MFAQSTQLPQFSARSSNDEGHHRHTGEDARLSALYHFDILDTPPEPTFDRLTRMAQRLFEVETSLISLVDKDRLWFKSRRGETASGIPRQGTFCDFAIRSDHVLVVPNAQLDPQYADHFLVKGPKAIRFYAGAPLKTKTGERIGTLCLLDGKPRLFSAAEQGRLADLASVVTTELEMRLSLDAGTRAVQSLAVNLSGMFDVSPLPGFTLDIAEGKVTSWNAAAEELYGWTRSEILGRIPPFFPPGEEDRCRFIEQAMAENGRAFRREYEHVCRSGKRLTVLLSTAPMLNRSGLTTDLLATVEDVTNQRAAERDLLAAKLRAEAGERSKTAFLASMSHELRTPLNAISGFAQIMREQMLGPIGSPTYLGYASDIETSGRQLLTMVDNVLEMARLESDPEVLCVSPVTASAVLAPVLQAAEARARLADKTVVTSSLDYGQLEQLVLQADSDALQRALAGLVDYALDRNRTGQKICVETAIFDASTLTLFIRSCGFGVPSKDLETALLPFGRVARFGLAEPSAGDLRLPLARATIEHHGGRVLTFGTADVETCFLIQLPLTCATVVRPEEDSLARHFIHQSQPLHELAQHMPKAEIDGLPFGVITVDRTGVVLYYNAYESRRSGLTVSEAQGAHFFRDLAPCSTSLEFYGRFLLGMSSGSLDEMFAYTFATQPTGTRVYIHMRQHTPDTARIFVSWDRAAQAEAL